MNPDTINRSLKKVSQIFFVIIRCYIWFNFLMMGFALYNTINSPTQMFRTHFWLFLLFMGNFWIILFFFFVLSICMKICVITYEPTFQDIPRIFPLIHEFLFGEEDNIDLVAHISLYESNEEENRPPPTPDEILKMEVRWGSVLNPTDEIPTEEKCVICLQDFQETNPCFSLGCGCSSGLVHKHCILEWFHFNERQDHDTQLFKVSCPSCRFLFQET